MSDEKLKTHDLVKRLREKFAPPAYALLLEVGDATGFECRRHIDALVVSLWPSRGLTLTGMEIKVSRSDWLKELRQPEKAEAIAMYCDYFYLVVGDRKIVQPGELPDAWGLIVPFGQKLKVEKEATRTEAAPIDRSFLCSIARKVFEQSTDKEEIAALKREHQREIVEKTEKAYHRGKAENHPGLYNDYLQLTDQVKRFEEISGIRLDRNYDKAWPETVGKAIKTLRASGRKYDIERLREMAEEMQAVASAYEMKFDFEGEKKEQNA